MLAALQECGTLLVAEQALRATTMSLSTRLLFGTRCVVFVCSCCPFVFLLAPLRTCGEANVLLLVGGDHRWNRL